MTIFNSLDSQYKTPRGPLQNGEKLFLRIKIPKFYHPWEVKVIFNEFMEKERVFVKDMEYEGDDYDNYIFKLEINDLSINIYHYYFTFTCFGQKKFIKKCENSWEGQVLDYNASINWQLTVYEPIKTHPNMRKGIMYQIFPDRFYKSELTKDLPTDRIYRQWGEMPYYDDEIIGKDFFGGNLKGITEKLIYLKKLNVSAIYLNPIWESQSNHRYDTSDYENVDPVLGTMEDLKNLIEKAHLLGMIVILDLVLNHTGSDSIYFNKNNRYPDEGAYNKYDSKYHNWYFFHGDRDHYDSWWNHITLPKLNQNNPELLKYVFEIKEGIIDKYYETGADGFRVDVADEYQNHFLVKLYEASKRNRDEVVIIYEVWENASNKCNYGHRMNYLLGNQLTSVMNYPVRDALLAYIRYGGEHWANILRKTLISIFIEDYPKEIARALMNFLSTHDSIRAITKLAGPEVNDRNRKWQVQNDKLTPYEYRLGRQRLLISYLIIYFLPGIPSIYYGDEIGMSGMKDPFCRKCFTWDRIDKKIFVIMKSFGKFRKSNEDFFEKADFDVCNIDDEKCILVRYTENKFLFLIENRTGNRIPFDSKRYILSYLKRINNDKKYDVKIIYNLNNNSFFTSIDGFGAIVVEATVKN